AGPWEPKRFGRTSSAIYEQHDDRMNGIGPVAHVAYMPGGEVELNSHDWLRPCSALVLAAVLREAAAKAQGTDVESMSNQGGES
ncbi:MAG: hypothetical protein AAF368_16845, partial [Planctomycetota bacterium]